MSQKKNMIIALAILLLLVTIILVIIGVNGMNPPRSLHRFSRIIEQERLDEVNLTIYFMNPFLLTMAPVDIGSLVASGDEGDGQVLKIVVGGGELEAQSDLLNQIIAADLTPIKHKKRNDYYVNARIYYVFENGDGRKMLDAAMWGYDTSTHKESMIVNGTAVENNSVFYDIMMPFLPYYEAKLLDLCRYGSIGSPDYRPELGDVVVYDVFLAYFREFLTEPSLDVLTDNCNLIVKHSKSESLEGHIVSERLFPNSKKEEGTSFDHGDWRIDFELVDFIGRTENIGQILLDNGIEAEILSCAIILHDAFVTIEGVRNATKTEPIFCIWAHTDAGDYFLQFASGIEDSQGKAFSFVVFTLDEYMSKYW